MTADPQSDDSSPSGWTVPAVAVTIFLSGVVLLAVFLI